MDIYEFSDQFDVMLNTFGEGMYIALDEYEKSVFLTQAQQKVVETLETLAIRLKRVKV